MHGLKVEKVSIQNLNILGVVASFPSVPVPLDACDGPYGPCVFKSKHRHQQLMTSSRECVCLIIHSDISIISCPK